MTNHSNSRKLTLSGNLKNALPMCCGCIIRGYLGLSVVVPFANQINWARPPQPASKGLNHFLHWGEYNEPLSHQRLHLFVLRPIFIFREYNATQAPRPSTCFHSAQPMAWLRLLCRATHFVRPSTKGFGLGRGD